MLPLILFCAGFTWDAFSFRGQISPLSFYTLCAYFVLFHFCIPFWQEEPTKKWRKVITWLIPFTLGGLYSALTVLYFRSSSLGWEIIVSGSLFVIYALHEFIFSKHKNISLTLSLQLPSCALLLNFLIPHWLGSPSPQIWIYSAFGSLALHAVLLFLQIKNIHWKIWFLGPSLWIVLWGLYFQQKLPPVPLILKDSFITSQAKISKSNHFSGMVSEQSVIDKILNRPQSIYWKNGQSVSAFFSVYAPERMKSSLVVSWWHQEKDDWILYDQIQYPQVLGGREWGWRFYAIKRNVLKGTWRVELRLKNGGVLGEEIFTLGSTQVLEHPRSLK